MIYLLLSVSFISFCFLLYNQEKGFRSFFEPGTVLLAFFTLVYVGPSTVASIINLDIGSINTQTISLIINYSLIFIFTFTLSYILFSKYYFYSFSTTRIVKSSKEDFKSIKRIWHPKYLLIFIAFIFIFDFFVINLFGFSFGKLGSIYITRGDIPTIINQFLKLAANLVSIAVGYFFYLYFSYPQQYQRFRWLMLLATLIIMQSILYSARSGIILLVLAYFGARFLSGKQIGLHKELIFGLIFIVFMQFIAILRGGGSFTASVMDLYPSEFISIYLNATFISNELLAGTLQDTPYSSYIRAFTAFVPSQINPDKWGLELWYLTTYHPHMIAEGNGTAFGIIPEAMINFGKYSMALQAIFLGWFLNCLTYYAKKHMYSFSAFMPLLFIFNYQILYTGVIRTESLSFVAGFVISFLLPYIIFSFIIRLRIQKNKVAI